MRQRHASAALGKDPFARLQSGPAALSEIRMGRLRNNLFPEQNRLVHKLIV